MPLRVPGRALPAQPGLWTPRRCGKPLRAAEPVAVGQGDVRLLEFLDVDVLERHDAHVLDEPGGAVHVPDPRVVHLDLEVDLAVGVSHVQVDLVGEVEPALRLDDVGELADDVAILPIELELHLGLVLLEILCAHRVPPSMASSSPTGGGGHARSSVATPTVPSSPGHNASGSTPGAPGGTPRGRRARGGAWPRPEAAATFTY